MAFSSEDMRRSSGSSSNASSSVSYSSGDLATRTASVMRSIPRRTRSCCGRIMAGAVHLLVDQATFSLFFFKIHKLSITLPMRTSTFWYYAPTCLLSDILVVFALQTCAAWACRPHHRPTLLRLTPSSLSATTTTVDYSSDELDEAPLLAYKDEEAGLAVEDASTQRRSAAISYWSSWANAPRPTASVVVRILLATLSLICVFITFASVSSYLTQHVVFSWKLAFDNLGSASVLTEVLQEHWSTFQALAAVLFGGGILVTLLRLLASWIINSLASTKNFELRFACIFGPLIALYLVYCAVVRPQVQALQATNLLIDGLVFGVSLLFGSPSAAAAVQAAAKSSSATSLYGVSNMDQPRLSSTAPIEHVFLIYLESGENLAWPYSPMFCKQRACSDIAPEYDTPDYFTPFFNSLVTQDPEAILFEDFRTNLAYTTKSHLATECGTAPEVKDGVSTEAKLKTVLPCLPDILKAHDSKFKTRKFIAQGLDTDRFGEAGYQAGWDTMFGREAMEEAWGETRELSNWWGYSDEEVAPFVWDWIDERLAQNERMFMAWSGATMHLPFNLPPFREPVNYTEQSSTTNGYLNAVKYTDEQLRLFFEGLKARNILDKSLIVVQGDHGPRIDQSGYVGIWGFMERTYRSPLLIRAPGLQASKFEQSPHKGLVSLDVLPTILDAVGVDPKIIALYSGQSALRERRVRDTYHSSIPGRHYPHMQRYSETSTMHLKARRSTDGDTCATDIIRDPEEIFSWCVLSDWQSAMYRNNEGQETWGSAVDAGLWEPGSQDTLDLQDFAREAHGLLDLHLSVNQQYWDLSKQDQHTSSNLATIKAIHRAAQSKTLVPGSRRPAFNELYDGIYED